ncbi:unnamed protein product [Linum tenue]|uniref:Uncharacterized protein n=1 Tax=Linum tenue TaxID=586396 RepID=A0AAV0KAS8_9ROSI|nr:unnamed protein product [Linum tenue]
MKARLVVFPLRGRNWCFSRSLDPSLNQHSSSSGSPSTFRDLWRSISSSGSSAPRNAQLIVDFIANKMNGAWIGMEKSPDGTLKKKIHGVGLKLLARVKPSEIFLKSISRDVTGVEIVYPVSLNARFVRRRLRHIAVRGASIHKKYFYGSITLLPMTSALSVLPLPNIPFFWVLFRTYSHWRALQGSETLLKLVSDSSWSEKCAVQNGGQGQTEKGNDSSKDKSPCSQGSPWVLQPSKELEEIIIRQQEDDDDVSEAAIASVCEMYGLDAKDVLKFKDNML